MFQGDGVADPTAAGYRMVETHTAFLVFTPEHVLKVKKPLDFGFVDFRDLGVRRRACESEVALNRRLAPDVYLGVANLTGPDGTLLHPGVLMRRLPDHARLSARLPQPAVAHAAVRAIARQVAGFHAGCEVLAADDAEAVAGSAALLRLWRSSLDPLDAAPAVAQHRSLLDHVRARATSYLTNCDALLTERIQQGRIRDGHGDLLADDVFILPDGPRILDCLEFDPALRRGDVVGDVAFLAMDLERLGAPDLAKQLFDDYREFSAETHARSLEHLYVAYRALVRAKVDAIRHDQAATVGDRPRAADSARDAALHLEQACVHLDSATVRVVLVGGLPGVGKSTVAAEIAERTDMALVASDVVRRQAAGEGARIAQPIGYLSGSYDRATTDKTYAELLRRTVCAVRRGVSVVADASWASPRWRTELARAVAATGAELVALECRAEPAVVQRRLAGRKDHPGWSDADARIHDRLARDWTEWTEATVLDTNGRLDETVRRALSVVHRTNY